MTTGGAILDVTIVAGWPPVSLSPNGRAHWAKKRRDRREYQDSIYLLLREQMQVPQVPYKRIEVQYTYFYCGKAPDNDNAYAWGKAVLDTIKDFGIVADDSPAHVTIQPVQYERVKHRDDRALRVRLQA